MGDKLRKDLFAELKHATEHFNVEIGSIKQLILGLVIVKTNLKSSTIVEMDFSEDVHKPLGNTLDLDTPPVDKGSLTIESDNQGRILDPAKINFHCSKLDVHVLMNMIS